MSIIESSSLGGVMENRWSDRRELQLDVDVFRDGAKVCSCQSRDVGLGGAFINMETKHDIGEEENIELVFHLISAAGPIKHNLHARVVRITDRGIGLRFHDFDTSVFRSLQEIMSYKVPEQTKH